MPHCIRLCRLLNGPYQPIKPTRTLHSAPESDKELWLVQVPLDFEIAAEAVWDIASDGATSFKGTCTIDGGEYQLLPDRSQPMAGLYALAGGDQPVAISKRVTIARTIHAQQLCFGDALEIPLDQKTPKKKGERTVLESPLHAKAEKTKKKDKKRKKGNK